MERKEDIFSPDSIKY